jgi:protein MpaA
MTRLGRNVGGYFGDTIEIDQVLRDIVEAAGRLGWNVEILRAAGHIQFPALHRPPVVHCSWAPRIYLSAGIHGDEPAGPLAIRRLFEQNAFPEAAWVWCCPCLNPTGFRRNSRETGDGIDLNRDYHHLRTPEARVHVEWLQRQPMFDIAFCLHEDWEAAGFYVYELNPAGQPSLAEVMVEAVRSVCPIDESPLIDGREAAGGIIRPNPDPASRTDWAEAFYLIQNKTRLSYTLEAPSDFILETRVAALETGIRASLAAFTHPPSALPADDTSALPP